MVEAIKSMLSDSHFPISLKSKPPSNPANLAANAINIFASYDKKGVKGAVSRGQTKNIPYRKHVMYNMTYRWMNIHEESSLDVFACKPSEMNFIKAAKQKQKQRGYAVVEKINIIIFKISTCSQYTTVLGSSSSS